MTVTPPSGIAFKTVFLLECPDWVDTHEPIRYQFFYVDKDDPTDEFPLTSLSTTSRFTVFLPAGSLVLIAYIINNFGAFSRRSRTFSVDVHPELTDPTESVSYTHLTLPTTYSV